MFFSISLAIQMIAGLLSTKSDQKRTVWLSLFQDYESQFNLCQLKERLFAVQKYLPSLLWLQVYNWAGTCTSRDAFIRRAGLCMATSTALPCLSVYSMKCVEIYNYEWVAPWLSLKKALLGRNDSISVPPFEMCAFVFSRLKKMEIGRRENDCGNTLLAAAWSDTMLWKIPLESQPHRGWTPQEGEERRGEYRKLHGIQVRMWRPNA